MHNAPEDGTWQIGKNAALISDLRQRMTPEEYEAQKKALKEFLCGYFSTGNCSNSQGSSISPMKATPLGGKVLKVRWAYPGCGKSGSLRLVVVAYCEFTSPPPLIAEKIPATKTFAMRLRTSKHALVGILTIFNKSLESRWIFSANNWFRWNTATG